jgi:magnesium-transporting ATPase (P-type)
MCWLVFGTFIYHAIHQLRLINHIYSKHTRIDLFQSKPLYAFSNITAFTAGSLAMISYGWLVVNPFISLNDPYVFISLLVILVLAIITFIWPQLGLHRLQVAEKERLKDVAYQRFESTTADLHRKLNEGELEDMEDLNYAISSLEIELNILRGIPTWPWEPETISVLITALALPLGLWILQFILVRVLGQ